MRHVEHSELSREQPEASNDLDCEEFRLREYRPQQAPAVAMQGSLVAARARYPRGFVLEALYSVITRSFKQSSDWLAIQSAALNWWSNASTFSIVPSGHSASTDHLSRSRRTTQKMGFTIATSP